MPSKLDKVTGSQKDIRITKMSVSFLEIEGLSGLCFDIEYIDLCFFRLLPAKIVACIDKLGLIVGLCACYFVFIDL